VGKSSRDLIAVMKMHKQELQLLQKVMHGDTHVNNKKDVNQEKEDCQSRPVYTKAYKLFSQVMTPVHVAIELRFHYRHNKMVYGVFEDEAST
jgi:type III secretory pathway component EscU